MSIRDQILQAEDSMTETVKVPEWPCKTVTVKGLSAAERDEFEASWFIDAPGGMKRNLANVRARLCVRCVVDESGVRVFTDEDADALGKKSGKALDRVYAAASKLSGLSKSDVEELTKN